MYFLNENQISCIRHANNRTIGLVLSLPPKKFLIRRGSNDCLRDGKHDRIVFCNSKDTFFAKTQKILCDVMLNSLFVTGSFVTVLRKLTL